MKKNMPPKWQPPAPAWQARWNDKSALRVAYFAIQDSSAKHLEEWAMLNLYSENSTCAIGPLLLERGHFLDAKSQDNYLLVSYWRESDYQFWWSENKRSWYDLADRLSLGLWRETMSLPVDNFETLLSSPDVHGLASCSDQLEGPILEHGYPGGMRDRITRCNLKDVRGGENYLSSQNLSESVVMIPLPENFCMIRSGQDWGQCNDEQSADYLDNVHPVLQVGMDYLRDQGEECGCYSMRLVEVMDNDWLPTQQTFGLGYAKDIFVFEDWAKSHPTHLNIFGKFMAMVEKYADQLQLQLWHEVAVSSGGAGECEYIQCHGKTGILPFVVQD